MVVIYDAICPSLCCRNLPNSTIFRKLGNVFLSTSKVFWMLLWAFRHLGSPFWPFLCIFGPPEAPRKLCRQSPKCSFKAFRGGKKVQNSFFRLLAKNEVSSKASLLEHFWCLEMLLKGPDHVRAPTKHKYVHPKAHVCAPKGTRNGSQNPIPYSDDRQKQKSSKFQNFQSCAYGCIYLVWGGKCSVLMF